MYTALQNIRKKLFWSLDTLKGNRVKDHYQDIQEILENIGSVESNAKRTKSLEKLLNHAVKTAPFYKQFAGYTSLENFKVIDKNMIRDHYDDFKSSVFKDKENHSVYTSGSTGTPFTLIHNQNKRDRNSADVIYFAKQAGFDIGHKLYYIRHWDAYNSSKPWITWMKNIYKHPVSKLSHEDVEGLLNRMSRDKSTKGIMCYASVLDEMKRHLENTETTRPIADVHSVIAISETLNTHSKKEIEKFLDAPVVSRYSNVENGILAQQPVGSDEFHINCASYHIEILSMYTNTPVEPGKLGRIVITDLYNYCMPMIRYDTGDIGQMGYHIKNGRKYPVLTKVEGRKMDMIFDTNGTMMSPYFVYHILKYPHIKQYQFIQECEKKYRIKLNVTSQFNASRVILEEFREHLGADADIHVDFVQDIPLLASGKRKFVINRFKNKMTAEQACLSY
ncbi:phenylacetate--CoA ligase family protein [Aquimarina addita]|uniref:Phenylacetate--CoA ligase family protein n=1 Tax=Aquimarina addita TaxID=870485 RepID=A0ABP6US36_9FLAO